MFAGVSFSHAGILRFDGQLFTVIPGQTACYRCLFGGPPPAGAVPTCSQAGVLGGVAGVIGSLQATEALKVPAGHRRTAHRPYADLRCSGNEIPRGEVQAQPEMPDLRRRPVDYRAQGRRADCMPLEGYRVMIIIPSYILRDMVNHAEEHAPVEACGLLVGVGVEVIKSCRLTNVDASPEHFSLNPKEQFAVIKEIRPQGWEVLAVYHSHPTTPARMSQEDLRLAFAPEMRHVIISLIDKENPQVRCFIVREGEPVDEPFLMEKEQ